MINITVEVESEDMVSCSLMMIHDSRPYVDNFKTVTVDYHILDQYLQ